ncbi:hypothetical protein SK128_024696 [Halocaridina rubra]|uniref:Uncharacterized protein n=1 Tax=Halocaridina rubra TaxID=373956 RepID=A0AAN8XMB8_HALRR
MTLVCVSLLTCYLKCKLRKFEIRANSPKAKNESCNVHQENANEDQVTDTGNHILALSQQKDLTDPADLSDPVITNILADKNQELHQTSSRSSLQNHIYDDPYHYFQHLAISNEDNTGTYVQMTGTSPKAYQTGTQKNNEVYGSDSVVTSERSEYAGVGKETNLSKCKGQKSEIPYDTLQHLTASGEEQTHRGHCFLDENYENALL